MAGSVLVALLAGAGCKASLCDPALSLGKTYVATISELYDQQSSALYDSSYALHLNGTWPSCQGWDGLAPGVAITMATRQQIAAGGQCDLLTGEIPSLPNGQGWQYNTQGSAIGFYQNSLLLVPGEIVTGDCPGRYDILLEQPILTNSVFTPTSPGEIPHLVLGRTFIPSDTDSGATCEKCADSFVAVLATK
jgi:hypothetical protein